MKNNDSKTYFIPNPDVSTRLIGDQEAVLCHPDFGEEKYLNATGRFIWERLDGSLSVQEIAERLCGEFESASLDPVLGDVESFLTDLSSQGFVKGQPDRLPSTESGRNYPDDFFLFLHFSRLSKRMPIIPHELPDCV